MIIWQWQLVGPVKKTAYRPIVVRKKAESLLSAKDDDELVDVAVVKPGDEIVLSTAEGMAIASLRKMLVQWP